MVPLICTTVRKGQDCPFMAAAGCSYNGGICREIVENCDGCGRKVEFSSAWYCTACPDPSARWKFGTCNMATHASVTAAEQKAKINPIKASKRAKR
ncbi:MAG: PxxKW family cysteine-rich protein [Desulfobacterales bacterium]